MPEPPPTRASLLARLRDPRDGEAWRQFVDLYAPLVFGWARGRGLQDADAADMTQEVLRAVSASLPAQGYDPAEGLIKATGRIYRQEYVLFLRAAGGKIASLREYFDPVRAARALDTPILGLEA